MGQQKAANNYARARVPYIRNFRGCCKKPKKSRIFWKEGAEIDEEGKGNPGKPGKQLKDCGADLLHYQELLTIIFFFFGMERKNAGRCKKNRA